MKTKELAKKMEDELIKWRRNFHENPEESLKEFETSRKIYEELQQCGIPCEIVANTGVVATIRGNAGEGKTIALRGDIDALSVIDKKDNEYASKIHGLSHACGHDCHGAMLLVAAKILNEMKDEFKGTVKCFFQPGEEVASGAKNMIKAGAMEGVDAIVGIHVSADLPSGTISAQPGPILASADFFKMTVTGKGGHGARPEQCIDAVVIGSAIVMNLQSVVSREFSALEPVVLTIGSIKSGTRFNVIAPTAVLEGTTRCFNKEIRANLEGVIKRIASQTAGAYRATIEMDYTYGVGPTINDDYMADLARKVSVELVGEENMVVREKSMGGEDFSEFSNLVPGVMMNLGVKNEEKGACYPHHHELFDVDEKALYLGSAFYAQTAIEYLNKI